MYAKIIDDKSKLCDVGIGTNVEYYKSIGMIEMEVERGYDGNWYVKGYAPSNAEQEYTAEILDYEYNSRVYELQKYMSIAMLRNDTDLIAELQAEFADLQNAYNEALAEL